MKGRERERERERMKLTGTGSDVHSGSNTAGVSGRVVGKVAHGSTFSPDRTDDD